MTTNTTTTSDWGYSLGIVLLRIWLGLRAFLTGLEKFSGTKSLDSAVIIDGAANSYGLTESTATKVYSLSNYHGVPEALYSKLAAEPLIPGFLLSAYNLILGPALLILGLTVLLGIVTRASLFAMGLLYTSLTFGLILIKQDAGVAWLGIHIVLIVLALVLSRHNRLAVFNKW